MSETQALELYTHETEKLAVARPPEAVLQEAKKAAAALSDVIRSKARPVMFNGEQYLEFEDWQTVGRFYGVTARVVETKPVSFGDVMGFEARAEAIHPASGSVVSAADAMCLNDEPNWRTKPLFQLRSMAQTRACAKALRNVLAWVVVLAGYKPTPAEEMDGVRGFSRPEAPKPAKKHEEKPAYQLAALKSKVWAKAHEAKIQAGQIKEYSLATLGKASSSEWTEQDCDGILLWIEDTVSSRKAEVA